jgi:DNA-binding transcriptional MerR regulator
MGSADETTFVAGTAPERTLLGIGEAATRAGVSERALRYYQQLGLITPSGITPGGLRRYSEENLARVARIRELQDLLGFNLDEIGAVLTSENQLAELRRVYQDEDVEYAQRRHLMEESLMLQEGLLATVQAKRTALEGFVADVESRISRMREWLADHPLD